MYCPSCGTQNAEGASFCRGCGANVSLVPQALTGRLPEGVSVEATDGTARRGRHGHAPSIERAVVPLFVGLAFLLVAFALAMTRMGRGWWFWLFIPAFTMMGRGVAEYLKLKQHEKSQLSGFRPTAMPPANSSHAAPSAVAPARDTGALPSPAPPAGYTPGSVTEGTTKLLEQDRKQ